MYLTAQRSSYFYAESHSWIIKPLTYLRTVSLQHWNEDMIKKDKGRTALHWIWEFTISVTSYKSISENKRTCIVSR